MPRRHERDPWEEGQRTDERLIALFVAGAVAFHPLILSVFDAGSGVTVLGIPLLFAYLFGSWLALILLLAAATEYRSRSRREPPRPQRPAPPGRPEG